MWRTAPGLAASELVQLTSFTKPGTRRLGLKYSVVEKKRLKASRGHPKHGNQWPGPWLPISSNITSTPPAVSRPRGPSPDSGVEQECQAQELSRWVGLLDLAHHLHRSERIDRSSVARGLHPLPQASLAPPPTCLILSALSAKASFVSSCSRAVETARWYRVSTCKNSTRGVQASALSLTELERACDMCSRLNCA